MNIHGTNFASLRTATMSTGRLRGKRIYRETLVHCTDLLSKARRLRPDLDAHDIPTLDALVARLEVAGFEVC